MPAFASRGGKSLIWYCFSRPPIEATSATPGYRLKRLLDLAFVENAQFAEVVQSFLVDERVLENPAHAAGVGTERDDGVGRELRADGVYPIQHHLLNFFTARRLVENRVDERVPHVRGAADRLDIRRPDQRPDQGLGDFRLEQLRTPRPLHVDDNLGIGDVGNGVECGRAGGVSADDDASGHQEPDGNPEADDAPNYAGDHGSSGLASSSSACIPNR